MQTRRLLAPIAAAALLTTAILGAGVANAEGESTGSLGSLGSLENLDFGSLDFLGLPNLAVTVESKCVDATAHVVTKVTNVGGTTANNVSTFTSVSGGAATAQNAATVAPGQTITYDLNTKAAALAPVPVFALVYATGIDSNPTNNIALSSIPVNCSVQ